MGALITSHWPGSPVFPMVDPQDHRSGRWAPAAAIGCWLRGRPATSIAGDGLEFPRMAFDVRFKNVARFMNGNFTPGSRAVRLLGPRLGQLLRAHDVIFGAPSRQSLAAITNVASGTLREPRAALFSSSGGINRVLFFLFEGDDDEPTFVVSAMADPARDAELTEETRTLDELRHRLEGEAELLATLPEPPLALIEHQDRTLGIHRFDPAGSEMGQTEDRAAYAWLARFQAATVRDQVAVDDRHVAEMDHWVERYLGLTDPPAAESVIGAQRELYGHLRGLTVPVAARHGDFWTGNVSGRNHVVRVFDWEWANQAALPFLDIWTWQFGALTRRRDAAIDAAELDLALREVEAQFALRGLPAEAALATALPSALELAYRVRQRSGFAWIGERRWHGLVQAIAARVLRGISDER